jgi:hypothetical protein
MTDPTPWLRLVEPILKLIEPILSLFTWRPKTRPHLIIIEQPHCWWAYLDAPGGGVIQLHLLLQVTNDGTAGLIMSRVQIRRTRWMDYFSRVDPGQDCMPLVELGGQRSLPGIDLGPSLPPRNAAVMRIVHHHRAERPKLKKPIDFLLRITDQRHRFHFARLKVPARD